MPNKPKIAFTCGDPAGVGPEIITCWFKKEHTYAFTPCLIGPNRWLQSFKQENIDRIPVGPSDFAAIPGNPSATGARIAWEALDLAATGCQKGLFQAVVTGPVSKSWLKEVGFPFPGHTEYFAHHWGGTPTMAFVGDQLRVVLATWHVPLCEVSTALTPEKLMSAVARAHSLMRTLGVELPRIGVCGLNPHAGENGLLGREERDWINPLLGKLQASYPGLLSTCQSADSLFFRHLNREFDCVIALYHDQGLAPLKLLEFHSAANVTLGLPWVRTSPDHGTAFAIAGKGKINPSSFTQAVKMAWQLLD